MLINIFLLIIFSALLIKTAEWVIVSLRRIARKGKFSVFAVSAVILAVGTSLPELFVSVTSSLEGIPELSLGVILGSNIANIAFIAGVVAVISGRISIHGNYLKKDVFIAFVAGILPLALISDGILGRVDGLILLFVYASYTIGFFKEKFNEIIGEHNKESFFYRFSREINNINFDLTKEFAKLFLGLAVLLFSSEMIISASKGVAAVFNVPLFVISLIVLSMGTTLPELVFSIKSVKNGEPKIFFGNLLGSIIANSTLIIGLASVIMPIKASSLPDYRNATLTFILVFLAFCYFIKSKHRLDRWEGLILVLIYVTFIVIEFMYQRRW